MGLDQSKMFISDSKAIKKQLAQAVILSKKKQPSLEHVSSHISKAYKFDRRVQQNLILAVEKLVRAKNIDAAKILSIASVRAISTADEVRWRGLLAALDVGYSLPRKASSDDMYRALIGINLKLNYVKSALLLVKCLSSPEEIEQRSNSLEKKLESNAETRNSLIYERLALTHINEIHNEIEPNTSLKHRKTHAPLIFPIVAWKKRDLLGRMISRDIRQKYHKSIFGWIWAMLEPLALTITFLFLHEILSSRSVPYRPLNIMIGILFWSAFTHLVSNGTRFLENNVSVIQKLAIPREIFLLGTCGFAIATLLLNMLALVPLIIYYELIPTEKIILLPVTILLIVLYGLGIAMFTSILQVKWRDTGQIVNVITRVGFYFTPVFYTIDMLMLSRIPPEYLSIYLVVNPMSVFLTLARTSITSQPLGIEPIFILIAVLEAVVFFIIGSYWFQKKQDKAVKYL